MARKLFPPQVPTDPRLVWASDRFTGTGTLADPLDVDAGSADFLYEVQYVNQGGNNTADGMLNTPKKTVSAAFNSLAAGGTLFIGPGVAWSDGTEGLGLTAGQGCRLTGLSTPPPGWLQAKASNWVGWGPNGTTNFGYLASVLHWGNQAAGGQPNFGDRTDPALWITTSQAAIYMQDLSFLANLPGRFGWQYLRDYDGEIYWKNVTSAERADGLSTFTVDGVSYTVTHMSRSANVVTARLSMPTYAPSFPGMAGSYVTIDPGTGAGTFGAGTFTIISASLPGGTVADITYTEAGANQAMTPRTGATASGHFCGEGDFIEFEPSPGITEWPRTMYRVQSVTATTITLVDTSGYTGTWSSRSATVSATPNAGRFVLQDRQMNYLLTNMSTYNVSAAPWGGWLENWHLGPTWDFGSAIKEFTFFDNLAVLGNQTLDGTELMIRDRDRGAAILCAPGKKGSPGGQFSNFRGSDGGFRIYGSPVSTWGVSIEKVLQDSGTGKLRPAVEFVKLSVGAGPAQIKVHEVTNADAVDADGSGLGPVGVDLGFMFGSISLNQPGRVINAAPVSKIDGPGGPWVTGEKETYALDTESYETRNLTGVFADGRLAGKRHDVARQFGVVQRAAWGNRVDEDLTTWFNLGAGVTITPDIETDALDGRGKAFRLDSSGLGSTGAWIQPASYTPALPVFAEGDHIVFGMYARNSARAILSATDAVFGAGLYGSGPLIWIMNKFSTFGGDGEWRWMTAIAKIPAEAVGRSDFFFKIAPTGTVILDVYKPTFLYLDVATYSANAAHDILHTFRPIPPYLQKGHVGTDVGQPFHAHGGLYVESESDGYAKIASTALTTVAAIPVADVTGAVPSTRTISTTAPLTGGGDLSANRTLAISDFVGSGASHARGAVPDPGAVAGTAKFLREDATWATPAGTGVSGVTASAPISSSGGATPNITHDASGVGAGSYTNASVTVDAKGHVTAASSGTAPVTSVTATSPIVSSGGATPNITHATSGVTAGAYTNATVTADAKGHVTALAQAYPAILAFTYEGLVPSSTPCFIPVGNSGALSGSSSPNYPLSLRSTVQLSLNVRVNTFAGGGDWTLHAYQNGVSVGSLGPFTTGAVPTAETTRIPVTGASLDTYALVWTSSGTVTVAGSSLQFDAVIGADV